MSSQDITPSPVPAAEDALPRPPRYDVEPFRPDNVTPLTGLLLLLAGVALTAAALGFVLSLAWQWFYLIVVFPVIAGVVVGAVASGLARTGKVRNPTVALIIGGLGGLGMMFGMHAFDYLSYLNSPAARLNPPIDLFEYIDAEAQVGVVIGENGANGTNLGYVGSYVYFAFEALLAAEFAGGIAMLSTQDPFCRGCNSWKKGRTLAGLRSVPVQTAMEAVQAGALLDLLQLGGPLGLGYNLFLKVFACPRCGADETVVATVESVAVDSRGRRVTKLLAKTVYPGEVLTLVEQYSPWLSAPPAEAAPVEQLDKNAPETGGQDIRPA